MKVKSLSCVRLLAIPWTAAYQAPPSMGFSRQEYWSGVPLPSPDTSIKMSLPGSSVPGILQARTLEWVAISFSNACMHAKSLQSSPTLCDPMDSSPPGSSVPGILQVRVLEWVAISFSRILFKYLLVAAAAKLLQSCPTLCDPIDGRPPGSPVPGILQARTLEWADISFSNA